MNKIIYSILRIRYKVLHLYDASHWICHAVGLFMACVVFSEVNCDSSSLPNLLYSRLP